jgi:pseudouridine synthase
MIRLQKYLADCGVASRRKAEELIIKGLIDVNGDVVTKLGTKIDPQKDKVTFNGQTLGPKRDKKIYLKLNKPRGVVTSCVSLKGEGTIIDLIKGVKERLFPIGRLDMDTQGLILLTNDGDLANRLMHPRYEHEKEYLVEVELPLTAKMLTQLEKDIVIDEQQALPAKIVLENPKMFTIVLREGKKRQIRRMVEAVGNKVVRLTRTRIGQIQLGSLRMGAYQPLTDRELAGLLA